MNNLKEYSKIYEGLSTLLKKYSEDHKLKTLKEFRNGMLKKIMNDDRYATDKDVHDRLKFQMEANKEYHNEEAEKSLNKNAIYLYLKELKAFIKKIKDYSSNNAKFDLSNVENSDMLEALKKIIMKGKYLIINIPIFMKSYLEGDIYYEYMKLIDNINFLYKTHIIEKQIKNIKKIIDGEKLKLNQIAKATDLSTSYLSKFFNLNNKTNNYETLIRIINFLQLDSSVYLNEIFEIEYDYKKMKKNRENDNSNLEKILSENEIYLKDENKTIKFDIEKKNKLIKLIKEIENINLNSLTDKNLDMIYLSSIILKYIKDY